MSSLAQLLHCAYAIPLTVLLQGLDYACTSIIYYKLHRASAQELQVKSPVHPHSLVVSPTERDQSVTFALPWGRLVAYSLLPAKTSTQVKYHSY